MTARRGPESFLKRQRERAKQQEQVLKEARRRERNARKREGAADPNAETPAAVRPPATPGHP